MMMEFKFNEEKAKILGITLDMCYSSVEDYMRKRNVFPESKGIYVGGTEVYDAFARARIQLPQSWWFLKTIDSWYWFDDENEIDYEDEAYNCLV